MIIDDLVRDTSAYPFEASVIRWVHRRERRQGSTPRQARRVVLRFLRDVDYHRELLATPEARSSVR